MGLQDILTGMIHGPRGARQPSSSGAGMSPIIMALLGLLPTRQSRAAAVSLRLPAELADRCHPAAR
jgi:hypothetical protein